MYVFVEGPTYAVAVVVSLCILGKSMCVIMQLNVFLAVYSYRNYCSVADSGICQLVPIL